MKTNKITIIALIAALLFASQLACSLTGLSQENQPEEQAAAAAVESADQEAADTAGSQVEISNPNPQPHNPQPTPTQVPNNQNSNPNNQNNQNTSPASPTTEPGCSNGFEVTSASIQTGQVFGPGESFNARWLVVNTGTCTWDTGYSLIHIGGEDLNAASPSALAAAVAPGDSTFLILTMTAPSTEDSYTSAWKLQSGDGETFGMDNPANAPLRVSIEVEVPTVAGNGPNSNVTPKPFTTPSSPGSSDPSTMAFNAFVLSQADQITLHKNTCFDLVHGQEVDCASADASFSYLTDYYNGMMEVFEGKNGFTWGLHLEGQPTETECSENPYFLEHGFLYESTLLEYYCFTGENNGETIYGWVRPTYFSPALVIFDYITYSP